MSDRPPNKALELSQDAFVSAAEKAASEKLEGLKGLSLDDVLKLPEAAAEDIVVAGKEVQLTLFRQLGIPNYPDAVLITAQVIRAGLGGIVSYHYEKGIVFFSTGDRREATEDELLATGG